MIATSQRARIVEERWSDVGTALMVGVSDMVGDDEVVVAVVAMRRCVSRFHEVMELCVLHTGG